MDLKHLENCSCEKCNSNGMVHIHVHSDHSALDGVNKIPRLVQRAKEYGHNSLVLNDHGNPSGIFQFYKECKKVGIKPILGLEFYVTNDLRSRISFKNRETIEDGDYHQSIFIKDSEGYVNYNYLTYMSFTEGFYYKPRIDFDILFERKKGLMATSSCIASKINQYLTINNTSEAEKLFKRFRDEFGEDFYAEIQLNELNDKSVYGISQVQNNDFIIKMANKYDVPILIGGDIHYLDPEDNELQDAIIRVKNKTKEGEEGFKIHARHLYYTSENDIFEFNKKFGFNYEESFLEKCMENSLSFAQKPNFEFKTGKYHVPRINISEKYTSIEYLEKLCYVKLVEKIKKESEYFPDKWTKEYLQKVEDRIIEELRVIKKLDVADYLLLVYDIINFEKSNNIIVGCGRGSAAGSYACFLLGITAIDPLQYNLLFERFLNEKRATMADIDWDSPLGARDLVLQYLINKYGREAVCNVVTFSTFGVKSALNDMSKALGKPTGQNTILAKKIVKIPKISAEGPAKWHPKPGELVSFFKELKRETEDEEILSWINDNQNTIKLADKLVDQMKTLGTHAGGIVVTPGPIYNFIPVTRGTGNLVTAFCEADGSFKDLSELGILKLDVLGLQTLNILQSCVDAIKKDKDIDLQEKIMFLELEDKDMLKEFSKGNNYGIFQMERSKMFIDSFHKNGAEIDSFEDIVAINAMNRPGPLEKYIDKYGYWKAIDKRKIKLSDTEIKVVNQERYPFSFMQDTLSSTYGAVLYQEQIMSLVSELTGMSFGEADVFRRSIAWTKDNPKYYTVEKLFNNVRDKMIEKGYKEKDVEYFLQYLKDVGGYSFNRSHSFCYSYIAWQCLYFKTYYPEYFYMALLNQESDTDEIKIIINEAKNNGIKVKGISINKSSYLSQVEEEKVIRLGYKLLKGMGDAARKEIEDLELNKCETIYEVLEKPFKKVNSTTLGNLIKLGCFDELEENRNKVLKLFELYKNDKIEKWFTRKRNPVDMKTMPEILKNDFDSEEVLTLGIKFASSINPHFKLLQALSSRLDINYNIKEIEDETIINEKELLGFQLTIGKEFETFIEVQKNNGLQSISEALKNMQGENVVNCYFRIVSCTVARTKTDKPFLKFVVGDENKEYKANMWINTPTQESNIPLYKSAKYGIGNFKKNDFGLNIVKLEVPKV